MNLIMNCQVYPESTHNSVFLKGPDVESPVCSDSINSSDLVLSSCPVSLHELFVSSVPVNAFGFEPSVHPISANTPCFESSAYLVSVNKLTVSPDSVKSNVEPSVLSTCK